MCLQLKRNIDLNSTARFVTFNVTSAADLDSMRRTLGDLIDYIEADLTGFTSIRALQEAAADGRAIRSIQVGDVESIPGQNVDNPCLKKDHSSWTEGLLENKDPAECKVEGESTDMLTYMRMWGVCASNKQSGLWMHASD